MLMRGLLAVCNPVMLILVLVLVLVGLVLVLVLVVKCPVLVYITDVTSFDHGVEQPIWHSNRSWEDSFFLRFILLPLG